MTLSTMIEITGWVAALLILGAYALLTAEKLTARDPAYQWLNVVGALGILLNSGWNGAVPSAALNVVWMAIGVVALWKIRTARKGSSTSAT
jgi:hypothetical protein